MKIKNKDWLNNIELKLKKIPSSEIHILYENDVWDGPLEGICEWANKKYYFVCSDQLDETSEDDRRPRKYVLLELSPEQLEEEDKERQLFASLKERLKLEDFYERQKSFPEHRISLEQVIGWFDSEGLSENNI